MSTALGVAISAVRAAKAQLDAVSHNLANQSTAGYKAVDVQTLDSFYTNVQKSAIHKADNGHVPSSVYVGHGSEIASSTRNLEEGSHKATNIPSDFLISGNGYFNVALPGGNVGYTRNGSFSLDNEGYLITKSGAKVLGQDGEIMIGSQNLSKLEVSEDGTIFVKVNGEKQVLNKFAISRFVNENGMQPEKNGIFLETETSGAAVAAVPGEMGECKIFNNRFENSNVDLSDTINSFMDIQLLYEWALRVVEYVNKMEKKSNEILSDR
ncbi:flagellar hook-basal body protein [Candidatus Sneabacter namystus]|uniref:Flagellar hook basal-body protein n=1 Tax=Candidatus Sneabacter namystus TaxID=2601646 RepID=A0A5C0ULB9_9RICK|nr:flagellar hook basal-body protein [Candidatus Sneabacter namystus]QEK39664.1 flagellar hook basal-body protein [Candidatus Sneabacter namystus]